MRAFFLALVLAGCSPSGGGKSGGGTADSGGLPSATGAPTGASTSTGAGTGTGTGANPGTPAGTPSGTPTGTVSTGGASISATCVPTSNPLRFECDVTVSPAQPVDVHFAMSSGGVEHTWSSEAIATNHTVILKIMKPATSYDWRATPRNSPNIEATGNFVTGTLGAGCEIDPMVNGSSTVPYIALQSPCSAGAYVMVLDQDADVVWCEDFQPGAFDPMIEGVSLTEDGTFLAVVADYIIEKDLDGNELLRLERTVDYDQHVHHDAFRKDGLTYLLFNETVNIGGYDYDLDGFHVFQGTTHLGEWHLADHFTPSQTPVGWPGRDYSHGNAVLVDDNDDLLMSLRHLNAVVSVRADPAAADFGTVNWVLSDPTSDYTSDYVITTAVLGEPNFQKQHNAHFLPTGELALFDNRASIADPSRVLQIDMNSAPGEVQIVRSYSLPLHCDFQGGAWHTVGGNPIGTCAPLRHGYEFDAATGAQLWDMQVSCVSGFNSYIPRFIPWQGPW